MADPPRYPDTDARTEREPIPSAPRWGKVIALVVILLLVALFVILHLATGGLQSLHQ